MSSATLTSNSVGEDRGAHGMPTIESWLQRFRKRQAWLSFMQGAAVGGLALLTGASLVMVLDAIGLLIDPVRWILSISVYGVSLGLASWFGLLRPWLSEPFTRVAGEVESACPEVREQLLSCVELSSIREDARNFSGDFLSALQTRVAQSLRERSIRELLPFSTIRVPCLATLLSWLGIVGLCSVPGLDMPQRLGRALIPFADIERPSRTRIEVLQPSTPSAGVPENQAVEFEIELTGVLAPDAWIQWRSGKGGGEQIQKTEKMASVSRSPVRYAASLPVGTQELQYRFLAGDGRTKWRTLRPMPRPRVARFKHRIQFPEYTGLGLSEMVSDRGSITVLPGSRVEIGIEPSIPLASAAANVERLDSGDRESIAMTLSDARSVWSFPLDCDSDLRYQFKLKARVDGGGGMIENTYSPSHELNVVEDHPPAVGWMATDKTFWDAPPRADQAWIVSPQELIPMAARIADDLPGAVIEQQMSINRGPWTTVLSELSRDPEPSANNLGGSIPAWLDANAWAPLDGVSEPTRAAYSWVWDVLTAKASSGDSIAIRIAATDSLQQVTYSPIVEFSLASSGFDRHRNDALAHRATLMPELIRFASLVRASKESLLVPLQQARSGNLPAEDRTKLASDLRRIVGQWTQCAREVRILANGVIRQLPRLLDQSETEYVVRLVSRLERDHADQLSMIAGMLTVEVGQQPKLVQRLQERIDRALQSLHEADDHSHRTVEIYRQFIGHETLTALTKDLLFLKQHEDDQIRRIEKMDFAMLARSQKIAIQYIDTMEHLAKQMEPFVSQHLQNGLRNWYRTLDQTRTELNHRIQQEPTAEGFNALVIEVKRFAENLRHQHWAFNLDGGLWWNISDQRRDLMQRGAGIHVAMTQSLERAERDQADLSDKSLDSDLAQQLRAMSIQSASYRVQSAIRQMLDRRELHQNRVPTDPSFAGDMGLAMRAWESQFENWIAAPSIDQESRQQKEILVKIAQAYRVLETAHDLHDIRIAAENLRRLEKYEWESLEGRLAHIRIWDSLPHRIETVHQWMKESGYPHPVADAYRALLWNENCNAVRRKFDPRRHANNENLVSASKELELWIDELRIVEQGAQPTIDEARRFLASLSPSLPELARLAARETRALQEMSKTHREDAIAPRDLQQQLETAQRTVDQLQDLLLETAMRQDLLDQQQLDIAKDSDRAMQWLSSLEPPMQSATESLIRAEQNAEKASQVESASEQAQQRQDEMASALETIEKHFSLLEERKANNADQTDPTIQESRAKLQPENQGDRDQQPLKSYDQADRLSEMAKQDPESLMRELEKELQGNEPMQRELSELSKQAAADAVAQLKNAANEEKSIAREIENADPNLKGSKERQSQQLRYLADETDRMAVGLLEKSSQVVQRMNLPETRKSIHQTIEDLRAAAREARNADSQQPASELDAKLQNLAKQVESAQKILDEVTPNVQNKIDQMTAKDDQQRQGQMTEMKSWQSLMRDDSMRRARDQARDLQQASDQARNQAEQKSKELQQKLEARHKIMDELKSHPDRKWLQDELDRNTIAASKASADAENAKRSAEAAQGLAKTSAERAQNQENMPRANLDRPNPTAALADEQIAAAAKQLRGIQQAVQTAAQQAKERGEPQPNASALNQADARQNQVANTLDQLVDQMARSARHEERLENQQGSNMLAEQSQAINRTASNEISQAQQEVSLAAERADQAELNHARDSRDAATPLLTPLQSATTAKQRTEQAAQSLEQLAQSIEQNVEPESDMSSEKMRGDPMRSENGSDGAQSAREKARLLDALDQQVHRRSNASKGDRRTSSDRPSKPDSDGDETRASSKATQSSLRQSAGQVAAQLQRERLAKQRDRASSDSDSKSTSSNSAKQRADDQGRTENPSTGDSRLAPSALLPGEDWGRLRQQRAEEITQGKRDALDPEYSDAIRAYFRALGERRK